MAVILPPTFVHGESFAHPRYLESSKKIDRNSKIVRQKHFVTAPEIRDTPFMFETVFVLGKDGNPLPNHPTILLGEILGTNDDVTELFAPYLAENGFHVIIISGLQIEYHMRQVEYFRDLSPLAQTLQWTRDSYELALEFAETLPEVDRDRIGLLGISFSAVMMAGFMADHPKIKAGVFGLAGIGLNDLLWYSTEFEVKEMRKRLIQNEMSSSTDAKAEKNFFHSELSKWIENDITCPDLDFRTDPRFPENVLLIQAENDLVIPQICRNRLEEVFGFPNKKILKWAGHYSSAAYVFFIRKWMKDFFQRTL